MRDVHSAFKQVHATFEGKSWGFSRSCNLCRIVGDMRSWLQNKTLWLERVSGSDDAFGAKLLEPV